jgi:hypothetical protein
MQRPSRKTGRDAWACCLTGRSLPHRRYYGRVDELVNGANAPCSISRPETYGRRSRIDNMEHHPRHRRPRLHLSRHARYPGPLLSHHRRRPPPSTDRSAHRQRPWLSGRPLIPAQARIGGFVSTPASAGPTRSQRVRFTEAPLPAPLRRSPPPIAREARARPCGTSPRSVCRKEPSREECPR